MAKNYALIVDGVVQNVIVAEKKFVDTLDGYDAIVELSNETSSSHVGPGWKYGSTTQKFSVPDPVAETRPRHITVGAFFDRFGAKKYQLLSANDVDIQARIKDASVRKYIDLDDPRTVEGLTFLQGTKFAINPADILNPAVQDSERP